MQSTISSNAEAHAKKSARNPLPKERKHFLWLKTENRSPNLWPRKKEFSGFSTRSYGDIFQVLSYEDLVNMYYTLHEADITKFVDIADEKIREHFRETNLKRFRAAYGCTQAELARYSGVTLRSIQMYEQRNMDINKASAETLYRISKVLGCSMENLLEK
ncbi:MAG: helix-turn-helix transcriptional regulator [Parasporobacterium sp.]|nr:helix-turn-helix transcriptional regulator [Parasporobacterium sp.]